MSQSFIKILSLETIPLKSRVKILSLETIPLKSRVNGFLKRNIQEFIFFQYRVFTKSIFTHPFLKHFHRKNSIYKITTPAYGVKEETADGCRETFSLRPNSSESEKAWSSFNL
jgi:hypothetical protein